jgi:phosphatidylserine/phosphatidylglycerophosphate/cardiolipin synthase-like enzyme/uncharacterized membrane protein YdjX (TVP38/TMEM64 family)
MHSTIKHQSILRPGSNVWRVERATRAAVLIDGAAYFQAVREALRKARHSVFILGWDVHSQAPLVGETGEVDDGSPPLFGDFLSALAEARPDLSIYLLSWDYALFYAAERELFPRWRFGWSTPERVHFRLDSAVPLGSAQHQKLIVVDDAVAFNGGLDLTIRRWDTSDHRLDNPLRVDPAGRPYQPFHDVQMVVDGAAARALAEIARERWRLAGGQSLPPAEHVGEDDPWPDGVLPDFIDVDVGVARTLPTYDGEGEVREIESLFLDSIGAAEETIYIENQFLTHRIFAERLARRLAEKPELEILIVTPEQAESWIEYHAMRSGRIQFAEKLRCAGGERVRFMFPLVEENGDRASTMVHSKVMIVDDRLLRVGSANLNNRSMAADTECDLALEARREADRKAIRGVRDRLIADHCGVTPETVAAELRRTGSLLRAVERLSGNGHSLRPVDDGEPEAEQLSRYVRTIADPPGPLGLKTLNLALQPLPRSRRSALAKLALAALALIALTLAWQLTPLADLTGLERVRETLASFSHTPYGGLAVIGIFVIGGLVAFPLTVLIAATAAVLGPELGILYAAAGSMASALVTFAIGALLGRGTLREVLGPRLDRVRRRIAKRGVLAIAAVRLVPIAPFTLVNLVAGASEIRTLDYVLGTALGLAPGMIVLSLLGGQVFQILTAPTFLSVTLLVLAVVGWIGLTLGSHYLFARVSGRSSDASQ